MSREDSRAGATIDWAVARRLTGGDEALLDELVQAFPEEAGKHMTTIRTALESGDAESLVRGAHTLKSSAKLFGAARLAACALAVEELGRKSDPDGAAARLPELDAELNALLTALKNPPDPPPDKAS